MESIQQPAAPAGFSYNPQLSLNITVIQNMERARRSSRGENDSVDTSMSALYNGLSETAKSIVDKINELLKTSLPEGVQSLRPKDVTPEATAERIVQSAVGLFDVYRQQRKDLAGPELVRGFMAELRKGVQSGYDDAFTTLESLGAFGIDGVQKGVEETKILLEKKLNAVEESLLKRFEVEIQTADSVTSGLLGQAGGQLSVVA